eukprot:99758-Amphidinium_carterae.1
MSDPVNDRKRRKEYAHFHSLALKQKPVAGRDEHLGMAFRNGHRSCFEAFPSESIDVVRRVFQN